MPDMKIGAHLDRYVLYKRLASAPDDVEVDRIRDEILDRYGPLPPEARALLDVIRLKIAARRLGFIAVEIEKGELVLCAGDNPRFDPDRLLNLLTHANSGLRVSPDHKIYAPAPAGEPSRLVDAARQLLSRLEGS